MTTGIYTPSDKDVTAQVTDLSPIGSADVVKMSDELARMAHRAGKMHAAAHHDYEEASWDWVGLYGVPIKHWREAYAEGCRDMIMAFGAALDEQHKAPFGDALTKAFHEAIASLQREALAEAPSSAEGVDNKDRAP